MDSDKDARRLQLKRKQESDDEEESYQNLPAVSNTRNYRTAKRRRGVDDRNTESSKQLSPSSEASDSNSSDDGWSSWSSDESDDVLEENPSVADDIFKKVDKSASTVAQKTIDVQSDPCENKYLDGDYAKLHKEEETILGTLINFWTSHVAAKASKELGYHIKRDRDHFCSSQQTINLQFIVAEKLTRLPSVVSVVVGEDGSQVNVTVSDRGKALELSEELSEPNINLIEARNSHFI